MEQILIRWVKIWSSLNNNEKNIVEQMVDEDSLIWSELNKGILSYTKQKYFIEDEMLKTMVKI